MAFKEVIICEKGTQAKVFTQILNLNKVRKVGKFPVVFYNEQSRIAVVHQSGHLLEQCPPEVYEPRLSRDKQGWDPSLLPIIPALGAWKLQIKVDKNSAFFSERISALLSGIKWALVDQGTPEEISIAVDNDKEGELLGWEVLDYLGLVGHPNISRLIYSANTVEGISKAYQNKQPGSKWYNRFQAGLARSCGDWVFGMNMTIALTAVNRGYLPPFQPLHTGRVILAIGYIICLRQEAIERFVPQDHFSEQVWFKTDRGEAYRAKLMYPENWKDPEINRLTNEKNAQAVHAALLQNPPGKIVEYDKSDKKKGPPVGFHRTGFERHMIKKHSAGLDPIGDALQSLYSEKALITYPRVEVKHLDSSMHANMPGYLDAMLHNLLACDHISEADKDAYRRAFEKVDLNQKSSIWVKGVDEKESHHAIIPTNSKRSLNDLTPMEMLVYRELCDRLIIQFMPDYEYSSTKIITQVTLKGHTFNCESTGITPLSLGWKSLAGEDDSSDGDSKNDDNEDDKSQSNDKLPVVELDQVVSTVKAELVKETTKCPKLYTDADLLSDLENPGKFVKNKDLLKRIKKLQIGTGGTRREHLKQLVSKGFVTPIEEGKGKKKKIYLKPTPKLFALNSIAPDYFKLPETSAFWEDSFNAIQDGEITVAQFMDRQTKIMNRFMTELHQGKFNLKEPAVEGHCGCPTPDCSGFAFPAISQKKKKYWSCTTCNNRFFDNDGVIGGVMGQKTQATPPERKADDKHLSCTACKKGKAYFKEIPGKSFNLWTCDGCGSAFFDDKGSLGTKLKSK